MTTPVVDPRIQELKDKNVSTVGKTVHFYDFKRDPNPDHTIGGIGAGPFAALVTRVVDLDGTADLKIMAPNCAPYDLSAVPFRDALPSDPVAEQKAIDEAKAAPPTTPPTVLPPLRFWTGPTLT